MNLAESPMGHKSTPLSAMAWWKRSLGRGDMIWKLTLDPPALSPKSVILLGSPPKFSIFSLTHFSAAT